MAGTAHLEFDGRVFYLKPSNLSPDDLTEDIVVQVTKGPLYIVRNVNVNGNTITVDPVVRREIPIVEGELYSQREVLLAKARVQSLGFFEEVDFQVQPTDEPDQIDLDVNVVERPTGSFSFGAGFSSQDSFVLNGSLSQSNLFGRGYNVQASADIGRQTQRFFFSATDPYFLGSNFSVGVTVFRTSIRFEDFEQDQTGVDLLVGHALTEDNRTRGYARYSWASRNIDQDNDSEAAAVITRELIQDGITSSLVGLGVYSDTRDNRLSPLSGYRAGAGIEFAGLGFFSKFLRREANMTYFLGAPWWLLDRSTFVVGARIGYALPLNVIGDYSFPRDANGNLFQDLGSLAGNILPLQDITDKHIDDFEDLGATDVIGGNKFMTATVEYRFPISETLGLQGLVFFDTGNAFAEGENLFDVTEWRYGTGVGVQWFSPFGPLAVILGFPLDPLADEDSPVFEFSVGGQGF